MMFFYEHSEIERSALSTLGTVTLVTLILRILIVTIADDVIRAVVEIKRRIKLAKAEISEGEK